MPGDKKFPYSGRIACMDDSSSGYASRGAGSTSTRHFQKVSLPLWEHHCLRLLRPVFFGTFKRQIRSFLGFLQCDFYYFLLIATQIWICPLVFWVHACWENVFTSACVSSAYLLLQKDLMRSCLCLTSFGFFVWIDASMLLGSQSLPRLCLPVKRGWSGVLGHVLEKPCVPAFALVAVIEMKGMCGCVSGQTQKFIEISKNFAIEWEDLAEFRKLHFPLSLSQVK